ncbi:threonylcarbamoyl-AMP synthase [Synergistales bacterium]|nr:threonylcarbamoyl-AMP synthase [Synergistales bacterium]
MYIYPATPESVREAARIIKGGGLVAFPTETVYGLGANALSPRAVAKIFAAKGRPQDNPLILHVRGIEEAARFAEVSPLAEKLARAFWPGPLTIVMRSLDIVPLVTRAGLATVAVRAPRNDTASALIREAGLPIAAPSANRSGRPSPTTARTVAEDLGDAVDMIIDGGETEVGVESTVADATGDGVIILRPGGVTREMLSEAARVLTPGGAPLRRSPGTRHRHYAPAVPLLPHRRGDVSSFAPLGRRWCYIGMTEPPEEGEPPLKKILFASAEDYAKGLYSTLRELETLCDVIVAELPEGGALGEAVRDRLKRAAGETI